MARIKEHGLPPESFAWYLDLRKYGSVPHAGFGMALNASSRGSADWNICARRSRSRARYIASIRDGVDMKKIKIVGVRSISARDAAASIWGLPLCALQG